MNSREKLPSMGSENTHEPNRPDAPPSSVGRESLTESQREQLARRLRVSERRRVIDRADRSQPLPLSFMQEQLFVHQTLDPESIAYNRPAVIRILGTLDVAALERGLTEIVRRHEPLRTVIRREGEQPRQEIIPADDITLPFTDLSSDSDPAASVTRIMDQEFRRPLAIHDAILWRAQLVRSAIHEHLLLITFHHLIFDHWSETILLQELPACYEAQLDGRPPQLSELPIHYADYAAWQRVQESTAGFQRGVEFWKAALRDLPTLDLPTDRPKPDVPSEAGDSVPIHLSAELIRGLRRIAQKDEATLFMLLLAAWSAVLHRESGQTDLVLGCPVAGRLRPEFEGLIGLFINTLPLRISVPSEATFRELLQSCRRTLLAAMAHQDVTLQQIVRQAVARQGRGGWAGFDVMFVYERFPPPRREAAVTRFEAESYSHDMATVDLSLELTEAENDVFGRLIFRRELWNRSTVERQVRRFQTLLEGIVADPDTRIDRLPLLTEAERQQIVVSWNETRQHFDADVCLSQLFERQVERTPDATAILMEGRGVSYSELNQRANRLAHHLKRAGAQPDALIGLCVDRSPNLVVAMLAILKAGAAYLPLDPSYPPQRLSWMLLDAGVLLVLAEERCLGLLPTEHVRVVCLDRDADQWADASAENPIPTALPGHLAYLIYTSGSTGKPKGVMIEHRSLTNHMAWMCDAYPVTRHDRVLFRTAISFDASVWEIWLPLLSGAQLCIAAGDIARDPRLLWKLMHDSGVTVAQFVPTLLAALMDEAESRPHGLRLIFSGGEPLVPGLVRKVITAWDVPVVNLYGPTETTIQVTHRLFHSEIPDVLILPIGTPIGNTQVYVLDSQREPVPIGIRGELYIGGAALARGYLNQAELTAEKFVPDPFSDVPGARLFRTGDCVRWSCDGNLEFFGRLDQQVKLRGFRIELGEIEAALIADPRVASAVVLLREDRPGDKRLVAYVVPRHSEPSPGASELRDSLRRTLTEYMVPSAFVTLAAIPLTPNGKVDRKALPAPAADPSALEKAYASPQTPVEELLADIWREVLGMAEVGRDDNFFELGGHSLAAMRVISRCRRLLATDIPVRYLFQHPTIAELARSLRSQELQLPSREEQGSGLFQRRAGLEDSSHPTVCPIENWPEASPEQAAVLPVGHAMASVAEASLPLSFSQQRLFFLDQLGGNQTAYNIAQVWQLNGQFNVESFRWALAAIVARHEPLRTRYGLRDGEPFQSVQPPRSFVLPVHDLRALSDLAREAEVRRRAVAEAETPFQLATDGQMLRAQLLWTADQQHVLLLTAHHIACDGFSLQILWQELRQLYESHLREEVPLLEVLPCRFADYVTWQQAESRSPRYEQELYYWRGQLADLMPLELPSDRPRPNWSNHRGARHGFRLGGELVRRVRNLSRELGTTLHITLLTAFQALLHRYSQQSDFAVGVPILGRLKPEFEPLIGMFVNTLALRGNFDGTSTFHSVLQNMHEVSLAAYDHQQIPFDKLVEELQPERHMGRNPLVQVLFQLLETTAPQPLGDVEVVRLASPAQTCHVDLEMMLRPFGDEISGELVYCADLFDASTIERLASHYRNLLESVVVDPETPIARLPLLSVPERQQLLVEWNDTRRDTPELCVHQLFEQQASRRPEAVALVAGNQTWTYATLNRQSNQLAHRLRLLGVGPESRVGISLERSPLMIVGVLAILKAGGAYVPLDHRYPPERLSFLLADSGVTLVLTQRDLAEGWHHHPTHLLCLDDPLEEWLSETDAGLSVDVSLNHLAYVMYTSGSTGAPKGVEVLHRGIVRLVCEADYVDLDETQSILQWATLSFDASTFEIWAPLLNGGRCVLAPPELLDPEELSRLLRRERVRIVWLTSTMFNTLIDEMPSALVGVEQLLVGGEALSVPHIRRAQQALGPRTQLINGYGPTESTTFACCYRLPHDIPADWSSIPIGRPISNTTAYVLDSVGQPTPIGVPGELHLGGAGLARGYLNRPELTAQQFVPIRFSVDPHSRLYRTGDRVRWRADGQLEFLGRFDEQLKILGFRIEPGEIEAVLRGHPELRDVAVMAIDDPATGGKQLVAYLISQDRTAHSASDWRSWLASRLPAYMIPAYWVELERFPRTPGGKVDRRLLPLPSRAAALPLESTALPMSALETCIAEVWCEALQRPRIERDDNFFDLGGHSLLALRVAARLSAVTNRAVPVALFFQCPTVAAMAATLIGSRPAAAAGVIVEVKSGTNQEPLFLFPPLGADPFSYRGLIQELETQRAIFALDWHAGNQGTDFRSLDEIARHCALHIRNYQPTGPYFLVGYSFGGRLAFETACRLLDAGEQVALVAVIDAGPGKIRNFSWSERLLGIARFFENLPRWIYHDLLADSADKLVGRLRRKAKQLFRRIQNQWLSDRNSALKPQIEDLFDADQFPPWFQQRQQADLLAAARHQPVPYPVKVTLFRARIRPLLHGHLTDLAWRHVARQGVEVHHIPGHHGTMMRPPYMQDLARKLAAAMNDDAQSSQETAGDKRR